MRQGTGLVLSRGVVMPILAKHVAAPIGPVELIKVDAIGLEPPQRSLHRLGNGFGTYRRTITCMGHPFARMLAGQHHLVSPPALGKPIADHLFGAANGFLGDRVYRVHLGSVDEVDPPLQGPVNLGMTFPCGILAAPCHRPKAERAHLDPRTPKLVFLHLLLFPLSLAFGAEPSGFPTRVTPYSRRWCGQFRIE